MSNPMSRTGVCVVILERQGDYLLITVRSTMDVSTRNETVRVTTHPDQALQWVRDVLEKYQWDGDRPEQP